VQFVEIVSPVVEVNGAMCSGRIVGRPRIIGASDSVGAETEDAIQA